MLVNYYLARDHTKENNTMNMVHIIIIVPCEPQASIFAEIIVVSRMNQISNMQEGRGWLISTTVDKFYYRSTIWNIINPKISLYGSIPPEGPLLPAISLQTGNI